MDIRKMTLATAVSMALAAPMAFAGSDAMDSAGTTKADREGATTDQYGGSSSQAEQFSSIDTNNDGVISEDELNVYGSTAAGGAGAESEAERNRMNMDNIDQNEDGEITRQEYMDAADNHPETGTDY